MGKKLANAPIFYILGQIRFSPVLKMADFVPKIHERLRREYPRGAARGTAADTVDPSRPRKQ